MKNHIGIILTLCVFLGGCSLQPDSSKKPDDTQSNPPINDTAAETGAMADEGGTAPAGVKSASGAYVEDLVKIGEDFLYCAYEGDIDGMEDLCGEAMAYNIERTPDTYIGTKQDYKIDRIQISITPLPEKDSYMLHAVVTAARKTDEQEYSFDYSLGVFSENGRYYITEYNRGRG